MQVRNVLTGEITEVSAAGPKLQYQVPVLNGGTVSSAGTVTVPGTIGASGTFTSTVIPTAGMDHIAVGVTMNKAGSLSLQRYMDTTGTIVAGAAITQAITADVAAVIDNVGTLMAQCAKVTIVNSATVAATPSKFIMVIQP